MEYYETTFITNIKHNPNKTFNKIYKEFYLGHVLYLK